MANAKRDDNRVVTLMGVTDDSNLTPTNVIVDPSTKRIKVSATLSSPITAYGRVNFAKGANVAAANDLSLGTDGNRFDITGNTTINGIATANWVAGSVIYLKFTGTPTIKHNTAASSGFASLLLSGSADFTPGSANARLTLIYNGTTWDEFARTTS